MKLDALGVTFAELAALPDEEIDLARGALLICRDEYPGLNIENYVRALDQLATGAAGRVSAAARAEERLEALSHFLFKQRRFHGNARQYYDPRNSYLNEVIDRRMGIPITLSIVYMEVAKRLGIALSGVNTPKHFLIRYDDSGGPLFVDAFRGGILLSHGECQEFLHEMLGSGRYCFLDFLQPVSHRAVLLRVLANLKRIYAHNNDRERLTKVLNKIVLLNPNATEEFRDRALLLMEAGHHRAALCDFITYLSNAPNCTDGDLVHYHLDLIVTKLQKP